MTAEKWIDIADYEGLYQVSSLGRFKTLSNESCKRKNDKRMNQKSAKIRKTGSAHGYSTITLCKNGIARTYRAHRIVLESFKGKSDLYCNHINGIKNDNRLENLEWVTATENINHAFRTGLFKPAKGENHCCSKLTLEQVVEIKTIAKNNIVEKGYWSKLARSLNVEANTVIRIANNQRWKHVEV